MEVYEKQGSGVKRQFAASVHKAAFLAITTFGEGIDARPLIVQGRADPEEPLTAKGHGGSWRLTQEPADLIDDLLLLVLGDLVVERQAQEPRAQVLGHRQLSFPVAESQPFG